MNTSIEDIKSWYKNRSKRTHSHMFIASTEDDPDEYPIYVPNGVEVNTWKEVYSQRGNCIHKVFDYSKDLEDQL